MLSVRCIGAHVYLYCYYGNDLAWLAWQPAFIVDKIRLDKDILDASWRAGMRTGQLRRMPQPRHQEKKKLDVEMMPAQASFRNTSGTRMQPVD
jgi:hypothetical protein